MNEKWFAAVGTVIRHIHPSAFLSQPSNLPIVTSMSMHMAYVLGIAFFKVENFTFSTTNVLTRIMYALNLEGNNVRQVFKQEPPSLAFSTQSSPHSLCYCRQPLQLQII